MKCDFRNISSIEFEKMSSDILSVYLNKEINYFKEGRDEGIDFASSACEKMIVGQAKRYNSSFEVLYKVLTKELSKVKVINPESYYVFVAIDLLPQQVDSIFNLFQPYMKDKQNVFYKSRIEQLLDDDRYENVRRKHLTLFIDSLNLLRDYLLPNISMDASYLVNSINEHKKIYVKTNSFIQAKETLLNEKVVLLVGNPGFGKTTISEMLVLDMIENNMGTKIIYSISNNISSIKDNMRACTNPMVVLLDDFIGSTSLFLNDGYANEIGLLINYTRMVDNVFLIINSRVNILSEGTENERLDNALRRRKDYIVNVDNYSEVEKAEILKNHMVMYLNQKEIYEVMEDHHYVSIVCHKNYNPRIISEITNPSRKKEIGGSFVRYALDMLDHPSYIYKGIFDNLSEESRLLLETLYSFDSDVECEILKLAFNEVIKNQMIVHDNSIDLFEKAMKPLLGVFIKAIGDSTGIMYDIANPSITDLLDTVFKNVTDKEKWFDSFLFFDQFLKIDPNFIDSSYFIELFERGTKNNLATYLYEDNVPSLMYVYKCGKTPFVYKPAVVESIINLPSFKSLPINYGHLLQVIFDKDMIDYYQMDMAAISDFRGIVKTLIYYSDYKSFFEYLSRFTLDETRKEVIEEVVVEYEVEEIINSLDFDEYFGIDESVIDNIRTWVEDIEDDILDEYTFSDNYKTIEPHINNYIERIKTELSSYDMGSMIRHYIEHGLKEKEQYYEKPNTMRTIVDIFSFFRKE